MDMSFEPGGAPEGPFVSAGDGGAPELELGQAIDVAGEMFRELAEELHRLRVGLRAGLKEGAPAEPGELSGEVREAAKLVRDLRAATQLVLEERNRVDKLRKDIGGQAGQGRLDLDAARDEIGRRLACLRRAG